MRKNLIAELEAARQNADLLSVNYTALNGKTTERPAIVDAVLADKGLVRLETDAGVRTFRIAGINYI